MFQYTEKRSGIRIDHKSPVMLEDPKTGSAFRARMMNYNKNGLFLETDAVLESGAKVNIGIENSPYRTSTYDAPDRYVVQIMWQRNLKDNFFYKYVWGKTDFNV